MLPGGLVSKESVAIPGFNPWVGKVPWRRKWQPTPVFLPGESHGQRSLVDYRPWGCKESDMTEQLSMEGNIPFGWNLRKGSIAREVFNLGSIEQAVSVMSLNSHIVKCLHSVSSWHPSPRQVCELPALSPVPSAGNLNIQGTVGLWVPQQLGFVLTED